LSFREGFDPFQVKPAEAYHPPLHERLAVKLSRAKRWEFWPAWLFYPPVFAYIVLRCLRSPYLTPFTAVNPGLEASGFVGERKHQALRPLQQNAPELCAEFELVKLEETDDRFLHVRAFAGRVGYPIVLKPDIGQRGRGVAVIRDAKQAADYLAGAPGDVIVQRYISGAEFGVFAYRDSRSHRIEILSITHKCFPEVTGDGRRTLAELIHDDARARLISPLLWQKFAGRIHQVPLAGERISLVEIGAHCRGSLFLDAMHLNTEALRATIAYIFDAVPGYHFGRIDLRCPDEGALQAGVGLKVLELNGVTAEAAHIYQPGTPLLEGWRSMFEQWRLAIEIGEANARAGAPVTRPLTLLRLVRADQSRGRDWS